MKFKFLYDVKPNMFGRLGGQLTLIGDDDSTPFSIDWFLDKVIYLFNMKSANVDIVNDQKNDILEKLQKLEIGVAMSIVNKENKMVAAIQRVDDNTTLQDLIEEEYGI